MNVVLKTFLSMSFSGSLLILAMFFGKMLLKNKISRQWQYYIWLIIIARLLLPFGPEMSLMGNIYRIADQALTQTESLPPMNISDDGTAFVPGEDLEQENENNLAGDLASLSPYKDLGSVLIKHLWLIWLTVALGILLRKITIYQSFLYYIKAGLTQVSDMEALDRLTLISERSGIKKTAELCINPLVSSPLLIGFFHPCIVLPSMDISEKDFSYIVLHELIHYKRRDMFYKWLVQVTVCLHWFNPLVHLMSREITKACEFSCDEAVLTEMGGDKAKDYGRTLLDSMAAVGKYKEHLGTVTLSENKRLLKERLTAIMRFGERSGGVKLLTAILTLCVILSGAFIGIYTTGYMTGYTTGYTMGNVCAASIPGRFRNTVNKASSLSGSSVLYDKLEREDEDEWNEKEKEWDEAQRAEYQAVGVAVEGKDYYYQGQLVNIFLDIRANRSFYTLNTNPAGTVNIKIIRDGDNNITDAVYMTETEATELLKDMSDPEDEG